MELRTGPLGLAGPAGIVDEVAAWLVAQVAVHHSPAEVELAFLLGPDRVSAWSWARWLPHLRGRVAGTSDGWSALAADVTALGEKTPPGGTVGTGGWPRARLGCG